MKGGINMLTEKQIQVLDTVGTLDGFRYFSGNFEENLHNCPTICAVSHKFYVVGPGYEIECENLKKATSVFNALFKHLI